MPILVPAGALLKAYRVLCLRCLRALKKNPDYKCDFRSALSKKCEYYTKQNAICVPVRLYSVGVRSLFVLTQQIPQFYGPEFEAFQIALDKEEIYATTIYLNKVVTVAAVEAPKTVLKV